MQFTKLFEPLETPKITLKNRLVVPPMETTLGGEDGSITPELIAYWEERAKGGFGTLILENSSVDPAGNVCLHTPGFYSEEQVPNLSLLPEAVHRYGAKIVAQICHVGRQTLPGVIGQQPVSASPIPCPFDRIVPHELTTDEVYEIIAQFANAADIAKKAGFDAVEIHGAHGYLISQFMSTYVNKRTDEFGGTLHNRLRFPVEIIQAVREKVGDDYPLFFRISADERVPGGRTLRESMVVAQILAEEGIDVLDVSAAVSGSMQYISAPGAIPPGYLLEDAAAIKGVVDIPVIAVGRLNDPELAEFAVSSGMADLVAIGRGSIADPAWPAKVQAGALDEIAPCVACNQGCYKPFPKPGGDGHLKYHTTCMVNPFVCEETTMRIEPAEHPKKVVVAGGGPGGMMAAWVAAARGHDVVLMEKQARLGGQLYHAAIAPFKQDLAKMVYYYSRQCERYGVDVRLGVEATRGSVLAEQPDAVIVATGGEPFIPELDGVDLPNVCTALDVLDGTVLPGHRVLIVGGGMVGCETADYLGEHLHDVTVVKRTDNFAADVVMQSRPLLMERLARYGVKMLPWSKVVGIVEDGVMVERENGPEKLGGFDTVVLALRCQPVNALADELAGDVAEIHVIGDAKEPRKAIDATWEAARAALEL